MTEPVIKLENVWKIYQLGEMKLEVIKGINLEVQEREFLIMLGPSGSGKSTLLHLVSCLDIPTKGKIFFEGRDVSQLKEDELAEIRGAKIGFVFQSFNLLPHLTALENVMLPSWFRQLSEQERKEKAEKHLASVGLTERMQHRPGELSGGEQQRVSIARSLINNPDIIVADEPTGDVDSHTAEEIMQVLKKLNQEGRTIIVVTHNLELQNFGSRVINLKDGQIV